ncbi:MAG TPA: EAL domain-containing protein [Bryobacteraceae bacterium]|jgi:PAS domain S-box-containing protein
MSGRARLLVVDDDENNRDLLARRLGRAGFAVEHADDGLQALAKLQAGAFDLVLLDQMMPGQSGIDILREIRKTQPDLELPVIMVTADCSSETLALALASGANDYITKPVDFPVALARIETRLRLAAANRELRRSRDLYRLASSAAAEGMWDWDLAEGRLSYSKGWKTMLGYGEDEVAYGVDEWFGRIHPEDRPRVWNSIQEHLEGRSAALACEYRMRHKDGRYRWVENRGGVSRDAAGRPARMAGCHTEITSRVTFDAAAALPNRTYLEEELRAAAEQAAPASLLLLELDGFGRLETALPPGGTVRLVAAVAARLREALAAIPDVTGAVLARVADHQFAVLLRGVSSPAIPEEVAERLHAALAGPFLLDGETVFVTASSGIALASGGGDGSGLLRDAAAALAHTREAAGSRAEVFREDMRRKDVAELRFESDLRRALDAAEFVVHYQPKVDLETGAIEGCEALVRWERPGAGLVMPGEFIPVAERTGLILRLGIAVLDRACLDIAALRRSWPQLTVSVNVSARQFADPALLDGVRLALARSGLPPFALRLEVTESTLMERPDAALETLQSFRRMGVGLKLDDFGTGYSSLAYLSRFPFHTLKIDRSFVARLGSGKEHVAIVQAILSLARSLGMTAVAEGIETGEQAETLALLGCRYGQGFWFSRPLAIAQFRELLAGWRLGEAGLRRPMPA